MHDLITGEQYLWSGSRNYVELDPHEEGAHIFQLKKWAPHEETFEQFDA